MEWRALLRDPRNRLDIFAGLIDGVLNALTLTSGKFIHQNSVDATLAYRVAIATGLTTIFVFFVAHYAEQRADLLHAGRQLNLTEHGRLAATRLGRIAMISALKGAAVAAICGVIGALTPIFLCNIIPIPYPFGIFVILGFLGVLGAALAKSFEGSMWFWSTSIVLAGAFLTWIGVKLNLVS